MNRLFFLLMVVALPVHAANNNGEFQVLGRGTISCGSVVEAHKANDKLSAIYIDEWVNGYLTALNLATPGVYDLTKGIDLSGRSQWIFKHCSEHPLDSLDSATQSLAKELKKRGR